MFVFLRPKIDSGECDFRSLSAAVKCGFANQVDIWFKPPTENPASEEEQETAMIDRVTCLRPILFDLFADSTADPPVLNYREMVTHRRLLSSCIYVVYFA